MGRLLRMNRREAIAALASTATLPWLNGCTSSAPSAPPAANADGEKDALALLDQIGESYLRFAPESATTLGIDTGAQGRAAIPTDRPIGRRTEKDRRPGAAGSGTARAFQAAGLDHATRTSVEVVRSAYATALEGFALPYGDITVGSWRNTPYVVIQNVGAYLDLPRFLDADHPIETRAGCGRVSGPAPVLCEAARWRARTHPGGARQRPGAAGFPDRQGAVADSRVGEERARWRIAGRIDRASHQVDSRQLVRARSRRSRRRKSRRHSIGRLPSSKQQRAVAKRMPACGRGRTATNSIDGRSRRRRRRT